MIAVSRRGLLLSGLWTAFLVALPKRAISQASDAIDLRYVNPELRPFAQKIMQIMAQTPAGTAANIPAMRLQMASYAAPPLAMPPWTLRTLPGSAGAPDVPVYVINAQAGTNAPAILHTHGGGFIAGRPQAQLAGLQSMAQTLGCVIVSVDYRLAPETRWQGSLHDNYTALRWLYTNAEALGADRRRIAVLGESAGGGHAALLAITARDRGEVPLCAQVLVYPMLDDRTCVRAPANPHIGALLWTPALNRLGWESFLGMAPGTHAVPIAAVPARHRDLRGLPPTFIGVGGIDLFVDEDVTYARRLIDAGVPTELVVVPGAFHGFDGIAAPTRLAQQFSAAKIAALRRAFSA